MDRNKKGQFANGHVGWRKGTGWKNEIRICICGKEFHPRKKTSRACSQPCGMRLRWKEGKGSGFTLTNKNWWDNDGAKKTRFKKGHKTWNKGTKGLVVGYWKGKKRPEVRSWLPQKHSEESRAKIKEARKRQGSNVWINGKKGVHLSPQSEFKKGDKRLVGPNNSNWKGGITPENLKARGCPEYKQWRLDVFKRDNFTCQMCGDSKGGNLVAHHKKEFSKHIKLRFDVNNGITLCSPCHTRLHKRK